MGVIDRVVIDPETTEVSHVIVRQGWLFTEDKVVPTAMIDQATADQIRLRADIDKLDELPHFEETHYLPYDEAYGTDRSGRVATPGTPYTTGGYARPLYAYEQRPLFVLVVTTLGLGVGAAWEVAEWGYDHKALYRESVQC